jgi:hypothetical protein
MATRGQLEATMKSSILRGLKKAFVALVLVTVWIATFVLFALVMENVLPPPWRGEKANALLWLWLWAVLAGWPANRLYLRLTNNGTDEGDPEPRSVRRPGL